MKRILKEIQDGSFAKEFNPGEHVRRAHFLPCAASTPSMPWKRSAASCSA
jgi:ketol-acid reductoisomerase